VVTGCAFLPALLRQEVPSMKSPTRITIEAVTAYRVWFVDDDGTLHALFEQFQWPVREPAEAMHFGVVDGFHAYASPGRAWASLGELWDEAPHLYLAVGSVALFGRIEEDGERFRASRAYPLSLWSTFDDETNRRSRLAADRYGIDYAARPLEAFDPPLYQPNSDDCYMGVPAV
jgi:hypothetical protein